MRNGRSRLFTKIFLLTAAAIIALSLGIFFFTISRSFRQSVRDIDGYERERFQENLDEFEQLLFMNWNRDTDKSIQDRMAVYFFRQVFPEAAAIYRGGEALYNQTPYEFDSQEILRVLNGNNGQDDPADSREETTDGAGDRLLQCKVDGHTLLLYSETVQNWDSEEYQARRKYQIIGYKDISDMVRRSDTLFLQCALFTLGMLLLAGGILFFYLRHILDPVTELKNAAASIAGGAYHVRIPIKQRDELGQVAESFNHMAGKVEEHVESLSRANETQRQLLGSLAHELKTPMTAIIGYADTLLTVRLSEKRRQMALTYIGDECRRLSRLSAKMLELTGLYEAEGKPFATEEVSVNAFLQELKNLTSYRLREKKISLEISCRPAGLTRKLDKDLMMSLGMNLVDNAFKASPEGAQILVCADETRLLVQDHGEGIPKEEIERVTEAFYMVDKSRSRSMGGAGLGLALCRKIAELHGFFLVIESEEQEGTRVSLYWANEPV